MKERSFSSIRFFAPEKQKLCMKGSHPRNAHGAYLIGAASFISLCLVRHIQFMFIYLRFLWFNYPSLR